MTADKSVQMSGLLDDISHHQLNTGVLDLRITGGISGKELFQIAERINPKRSFLFVSNVLGRHIPVRPQDHFAAVDLMVDLIPDKMIEGPVLVMGYAETAVGIGAAVARGISRRRPKSDPLYLSTTRHPVAGRDWARFSEGHSHATAHHVMSPSYDVLSGPPLTLVLVDDETTTGKTFAALFEAVRKQGLPVGRVLLLTLTDWSEGSAVCAIADLAPDIPVNGFSLMQGGWTWTKDGAAILPELPGWSDQPILPSWIADRIGDTALRAPRLGIRPSQNGTIVPAGLPKVAFRQPVLVIGTGEHVWGPMLLAEQLEKDGADVRFVATTRSPIMKGSVICHKVTFADHFGIGIPMYLHNVPERPNAQVIIMTETGSEGICKTLKAHLGHGHIIDGAGHVTEFIAQ